MLLLTRLTDDNYLLVHEYGAVEIAQETVQFYNDIVHDVLSHQPKGEVIPFDEIYIKCDCGEERDSVLWVCSDGNVAIIQDGEKYGAKIDQRYCSRIYEAMKNFPQEEMLRESSEANEVKP